MFLWKSAKNYQLVAQQFYRKVMLWGSVQTQNHFLLFHYRPVTSLPEGHCRDYDNVSAVLKFFLDSVVKLKACYALLTYNEERPYGGTSKA